MRSKNFFNLFFNILGLCLLLLLSFIFQEGIIFGKRFELMRLVVAWILPAFIILKRIKGKFLSANYGIWDIIVKILKTSYLALVLCLASEFALLASSGFDFIVARWIAVFFYLVGAKILCWIMLMYVWYPPIFDKVKKGMPLGYIIALALMLFYLTQADILQDLYSFDN